MVQVGQAVLDHYIEGLPQGLQESMIAFEPTHHYQNLDN